MIPPFAFNGVVRLTRVGTAYLVFTVFVGFAALNTGNNALYIGLSFMLGALIVSGVASKSGLRSVAVNLDHVGQVWAGKPARAAFRILNRSRIWSARDVVVASPHLSQPLLIGLLSRNSSLERDAQLEFDRRGRRRLGHVDLYTRFPFGLFLKKRRIAVDMEVVVLPRLFDRQILRRNVTDDPGEVESSHRPGAGSDVYAFRDFVRGDSTRHVHWKKSASVGRWITKQPELETGETVTVVVDPTLPVASSEDQFEEMISEAATYIRDALEAHRHVTLELPELTLRADPFGSPLPLYQALALLEFRRDPWLRKHGKRAILFSLSRGQHETRIA